MAAAAIPADVADKLHALYPNDKVTGYAMGQIRGAMTIRKAGSLSNSAPYRIGRHNGCFVVASGIFAGNRILPQLIQSSPNSSAGAACDQTHSRIACHPPNSIGRNPSKRARDVPGRWESVCW